MSSFITFSGDISASIWNSTFKTILQELENVSPENQVAAHILKENPIAAPIGGLNLTTLRAEEILGFIQFIKCLRENAMLITASWTISNNIAQFPTDLETTIKMANKAHNATTTSRSV